VIDASTIWLFVLSAIVVPTCAWLMIELRKQRMTLVELETRLVSVERQCGSCGPVLARLDRNIVRLGMAGNVEVEHP